MNKWECEHSGCDNTAVGIGGAVGLRAIGWYFAMGPRIYCPVHYIDGQPKAAAQFTVSTRAARSLGMAKRAAEEIQEMILP